MKTRFLITLLVAVASFAASAQEVQSIFKGAKTTGGYGALSNKFTTIQGQYANMCEVYGGVFLNRRWMLGLAFAGSTNYIEVPLEYSANPLEPMRTMMLDGAPLARSLRGRVGWELRLVVLGGLRILEGIEAVGYDVFHHRPALGRGDWARLGWRALNYGKLG